MVIFHCYVSSPEGNIRSTPLSWLYYNLAAKLYSEPVVLRRIYSVVLEPVVCPRPLDPLGGLCQDPSSHRWIFAKTIQAGNPIQKHQPTPTSRHDGSSSFGMRLVAFSPGPWEMGAMISDSFSEMSKQFRSLCYRCAMTYLSVLDYDYYYDPYPYLNLCVRYRPQYIYKLWAWRPGDTPLQVGYSKGYKHPLISYAYRFTSDPSYGLNLFKSHFDSISI